MIAVADGAFGSAAVALRKNKVLAMSEKAIDVYWRHNGQLIQTANEFEAKKVRFLMRQFDDVVIMAKMGSDTSNVYIVRSLNEKRGTTVVRQAGADKNAAA